MLHPSPTLKETTPLQAFLAPVPTSSKSFNQSGGRLQRRGVSWSPAGSCCYNINRKQWCGWVRSQSLQVGLVRNVADMGGNGIKHFLKHSRTELYSLALSKSGPSPTIAHTIHSLYKLYTTHIGYDLYTWVGKCPDSDTATVSFSEQIIITILSKW